MDYEDYWMLGTGSEKSNHAAVYIPLAHPDITSAVLQIS